MRLLISLAAIASCLSGQAPSPTADLYRRTHDALVASFLPVAELKNEPYVTQLLNAAGDGIWTSVAQVPQFRQLITPFTNLSGFGSACGMDALVRTAATQVFAEMSPSQRGQAL